MLEKNIIIALKMHNKVMALTLILSTLALFNTASKRCENGP